MLMLIFHRPVQPSNTGAPATPQRIRNLYPQAGLVTTHEHRTRVPSGGETLWVIKRATERLRRSRGLWVCSDRRHHSAYSVHGCGDKMFTPPTAVLGVLNY